MSKVTILGIIWVFMVIATVIGLSVYGSLVGSDPMAFLRNGKGGLLISGGIMFGSVLMMLGGIFNNNKYYKLLTPTKKDLNAEQRAYFEGLLANNELNPEERKAIERKLSEL